MSIRLVVGLGQDTTSFYPGINGELLYYLNIEVGCVVEGCVCVCGGGCCRVEWPGVCRCVYCEDGGGACVTCVCLYIIIVRVVWSLTLLLSWLKII